MESISELVRGFAFATNEFSSFSAGNIGMTALGLIIGHLGIGLGYFGQPHLLSRFISVKDQDTLVKSGKYAMVGFVLYLLECGYYRRCRSFYG